MSQPKSPEFKPGAGPQRVKAAHDAIACLQRLSAVFVARRAQLAQEVGLTEHQWGVLEEISNEHFIPSMFARARDSSAAAVSKTIRGLLDKELVSVSVSKSDGRQRNYELTPRGRTVMESLRARRQAAVEDIWLKLDPEKLAAFTEVGNTVVERIEEYIARTKAQSLRPSVDKVNTVNMERDRAHQNPESLPEPASEGEL